MDIAAPSAAGRCEPLVQTLIGIQRRAFTEMSERIPFCRLQESRGVFLRQMGVLTEALSVSVYTMERVIDLSWKEKSEERTQTVADILALLEAQRDTLLSDYPVEGGICTREILEIQLQACRDIESAIRVASIRAAREAVRGTTG